MAKFRQNCGSWFLFLISFCLFWNPLASKISAEQEPLDGIAINGAMTLATVHETHISQNNCQEVLRPKMQINPTKIKAIVFDFGGVVAKTDRGEVGAFIASHLGLTQEEAARSLAALKEWTRAGQEEWKFWVDYTKKHNRTLPNGWQEQLDEARFQALKVIPGTIDLVRALQKQGFKTALLSNVKKGRASIKSRLGYYKLFDPAIFSYEIGVNKPELKAYAILLQRLQMPPEAVLFIDNKPANVEAAKTFGIDAILFENAKQLAEELKLRGVEVP